MLSDKIALVTGASSGIGRACARRLAAAGARVILCARRGEQLETLAGELEGDSYSLSLDIRDRQAVEETLHSLPARWADVDILVNAAGVALGLAPVHEADADDIDRIIDTNLEGLLWVTRAIVPAMISRGSGHVVNIGSIAAEQVYPGGSVYAASKAAVAAITKGLRIDLLGTGVRVSTVDPGFVKTEIILNRVGGDVEAFERYYEGMTPLSADDIADAVVWAASRPEDVQVAEIVMLPRDQASFHHVHRRD